MLHSHECGSAGREKVRRVREWDFWHSRYGRMEIETMNPDQRGQAGWDGEACDRASGPP